MVFCTAILSSFVIDWMLRLKVTTNINMFYIYQLPVPRFSFSDDFFQPIVDRAARLICTSPEYDELAKAVGLGSCRDGVTDPAERARLKAELDGLVGHLYGLNEEEFIHILNAFPIVSNSLKDAVKKAFKDVAIGLIEK